MVVKICLLFIFHYKAFNALQLQLYKWTFHGLQLLQIMLPAEVVPFQQFGTFHQEQNSRKMFFLLIASLYIVRFFSKLQVFVLQSFSFKWSYWQHIFRNCWAGSCDGIPPPPIGQQRQSNVRQLCQNIIRLFSSFIHLLHNYTCTACCSFGRLQVHLDSCQCCSFYCFCFCVFYILFPHVGNTKQAFAMFAKYIFQRHYIHTIWAYRSSYVAWLLECEAAAAAAEWWPSVKHT